MVDGSITRTGGTHWRHLSSDSWSRGVLRIGVFLSIIQLSALAIVRLFERNFNPAGESAMRQSNALVHPILVFNCHHELDAILILHNLLDVVDLDGFFITAWTLNLSGE